MLNPVVFFWRNKRRGVTLLAILAVSVFCVGSVMSIVASVTATSKDVFTTPYQRFSLATYTGTAKDGGVPVVQKLRGVGAMFPVAEIAFGVNTIVGQTTAFGMLADSRGDLAAIASHLGVDVSASTMSSIKNDEVFMHEALVKNQKLHIGSTFGQPLPLKIIGSFSGNSRVTIGLTSPAELNKWSANSTVTYILFPAAGTNIDTLNHSLSALSPKNWIVTSYDTQTRQFNKDMASLNIILLIVIIMVSLCIAVAMSALVYTVYSGRYDEFAILHAMGYRKRQIRTLIFSETIIQSSVAWFLGYGLSLVALAIIGRVVYFNRLGQSMPIFTWQSLAYTLIMPILVVLLAAWPTARHLSKTDLVSVIERR